MDVKIYSRNIYRMCKTCGGHVYRKHARYCTDCEPIIQEIMRDDVKSQERRATLKKQKVWTRMAEFGVGEKDIENMKQLKRQLSIMLNQNYITQEEYDEYQPMFDILKTYTQVVAVN